MTKLFQTFTSIVLLGTGEAMALVQPATAKTPVEINSTAKAITVMISGQEEQGTGVIVQQQGKVYTLLTAAHVLNNEDRKNNKYQVTTPDNRQYQLIPGSIRKVDGDIDLAIGKFTATANYPVARIGNSRQLSGGTEVYVAGFPAATEAITESVFVFRKGEVSASSSKVFAGGYSLIYSNDTLSGMSGGPVLNSEGELVAIHGKGDREQSSTGAMGAKTGFNLGIPIDRFFPLAKKIGLMIETPIAIQPAKPSPADDYLAAGLEKERKNDYQGALLEYDRAIEANPRYAEAYMGRGFANYKLGERSPALTDFNTAITLNPKLARAYVNRANMRLEFKDWKYAIMDYDKAIEIDANYVEAYIGRGVARESWFNSPVGGMVDFNLALIIDPRSLRAYRGRADARLKNLEFKGAIADYNKALNLSKIKIASDYTGRGLAKSGLKDYVGAIADYNIALGIDPNRAKTYYDRGISKYELNDKSGAIKDLQQAHKLLVAKEKGKSSEANKIIRRLKEWGAEVS
jgi:tetratricopeptide (TPR) repeat protein/V8-like Glu-specific endopeptidase